LHTTNEFSLPTANSSPYGITAGPDANLWFTELSGNRIGEINPTTHTINEFSLPTANSSPYGITAGPDGNLWFTESNGNRIGEINPSTHTINEFGLPTANGSPYGITAGPDGNLWFTESNGNRIGEINPSTHTINEFNLPTANENPVAITAGPDGNLWFAEGTLVATTTIGQINPTTHAISEFTLPTANSSPYGITAGPDGNLWFAEQAGDQVHNRIGELNPTTDAIKEFSIPTAFNGAVGITSGPDGNLWFTEPLAPQIGKLIPGPAPYVVHTTADSGAGSLRDAITQVNADASHSYASPSNPSVDEIDFNITAASDTGRGYNPSNGVATITPQASLPAITNAVFIDGYSQAGASGNTNPFGQADNAVLKVELNGAAVANANALMVSAPNSTVCGLVINRAGNGIEIVQTGSGNDWIYGNFIGVDPTGMVNEGNGTGVYVVSANNVTIGSKNDGHDALERNVISANEADPNNANILVRDNSTFVTIQGNYVGTDATGSAQFYSASNDDINLREESSSNLNITGNVVSGPAYIGMHLVGDTNVTIQGNRIGTTADGTQTLGAGHTGGGGIFMEYCANVLIGGVDTNAPGAALAGAGNLISGNNIGLEIEIGPSVTIQGNYVGTDITGSYAIPNLSDGVGVGGCQNVMIGGVTAGTGNLVSGNGRRGIGITETAGPVLIEDNTIGTDATGKYAIGNAWSGVDIGAASGVTVGGATQAARNLVSGNGGGIRDVGTGNLIEGNLIGTDLSGTKAVPNGGGIALGGTNSTVIGNLISGNAQSGISLLFTTGDTIQNNYIGTDATGSLAVGNTGLGIDSYGANNVTLGGIGRGNLISANGAGVLVGGNGWLIQGNLIGTNAAGTSALGNQASDAGLRIAAGANNTVGGTAPGAGNIIGGNAAWGVSLTDGAHNNVVEGNYIGTNSAGANLGNGRNGIVLYAGANNNQIGGVGTGAGNFIAYNSAPGVSIGVTYDANVGVVGNAILGNAIHDNSGLGIVLATAAANDSQPAPTLTSIVGETSPTITGTLATVAGTIYRIEFFASAAPASLSNSAGTTLLGSIYMTGDGTTKSFTAPGLSPVPMGQNYFTATATVATPSGSSYTYGDTSAFSPYLVRNILTVTNTNDSGTGSLRAAVTQADADAGLGLSDVITFDPSLAGKTIVLTSGQLELSGSGTITIDGSGLSTQVTVSGNNATRVFQVDSGLRAEFDRLTITAGKNTTGVGGGGILNLGALTLDSDLLTSNSSTSGGGGIRNQGILTVLDNSVITTNTAQNSWGGGIDNVFGGQLSISSSQVTNNSSGGDGGGIDNYYAASANLTNVIISGNTAISGGGMTTEFGSPTITLSNVTFSGNSASNSGGGI
jgi:parallel beta-helix repeat protein